MRNFLHLSKFRLTALLALVGMTLLITGCQVCACEPPRDYAMPFSADPSTLALWHFDEGMGQITGDSSGNGYDLTLGSNTTIEAADPSWDSAGKFNQALSFNAAGQYATRQIIMNAFSSNQLTVEFWVKTYLSGIDQDILSANNSIFSFQINSSNATVFTLSDGITRYQMIGVSNIADGNWHYIAGVFNGPTSTGTLYVDGSPENQDTSIALTLPVPTGYNVGAPIGVINGLIDEVRLSDIARSGNEIFEYYRPF